MIPHLPSLIEKLRLVPKTLRKLNLVQLVLTVLPNCRLSFSVKVPHLPPNINYFDVKNTTPLNSIVIPK